jgi:hypothetical protein
MRRPKRLIEEDDDAVSGTRPDGGAMRELIVSNIMTFDGYASIPGEFP